MKSEIAFGRIFYIIVCLLGVTSYLLLISDEKLECVDIFGDLLTVISILAGVLIAVVSIFTNIPDGLSIKGAILHNSSIEGKVERLLYILRLYLISIVLILFYKSSTPLLVDYTDYHILFKKTALFFGLLSVLFSFGLPSMISQAFKK